MTLTHYLRKTAVKRPTNANMGYSSHKSRNPCTIYDIAGIAKEAYNIAFSKKNIESAFKATGGFPLNRDIYQMKISCQVKLLIDPTLLFLMKHNKLKKLLFIPVIFQ